MAREREILELIHEQDWLRRFLAQFLSIARDSIDRARAELEYQPGCFGVSGVLVGTWHSSLRIVDMRSPSFRQSEPIREATPHPEQAMHKFYGEVEQEIKAKLFLEQLNDIYDTLKYKDALRVRFAAFRLRRTAKD
ncbi:hypothetical protein M9H77_16155 [Catharanthus roseus]|uniref:Uncharacterized protein n=1 Tax=Catharanthus roseus TaxID=4058 RepID=A0ACC0B123_CATRO|nr:hypothetical protein M9H77_16155 [Catharanthus roseus]